MEINTEIHASTQIVNTTGMSTSTSPTGNHHKYSCKRIKEAPQGYGPMNQVTTTGISTSPPGNHHNMLAKASGDLYRDTCKQIR
jgi:hypothetical protein